MNKESIGNILATCMIAGALLLAFVGATLGVGMTSPAWWLL